MTKEKTPCPNALQQHLHQSSNHTQTRNSSVDTTNDSLALLRGRGGRAGASCSGGQACGVGNQTRAYVLSGNGAIWEGAAAGIDIFCGDDVGSTINFSKTVEIEAGIG